MPDRAESVPPTAGPATSGLNEQHVLHVNEAAPNAMLIVDSAGK